MSHSVVYLWPRGDLAACCIMAARRANFWVPVKSFTMSSTVATKTFFSWSSAYGLQLFCALGQQWHVWECFLSTLAAAVTFSLGCFDQFFLQYFWHANTHGLYSFVSIRQNCAVFVVHRSTSFCGFSGTTDPTAGAPKAEFHTVHSLHCRFVSPEAYPHVNKRFLRPFSVRWNDVHKVFSYHNTPQDRENTAFIPAS